MSLVVFSTWILEAEDRDILGGEKGPEEGSFVFSLSLDWIDRYFTTSLATLNLGGLFSDLHPLYPSRAIVIRIKQICIEKLALLPLLPIIVSFGTCHGAVIYRSVGILVVGWCTHQTPK